MPLVGDFVELFKWVDSLMSHSDIHADTHRDGVLGWLGYCSRLMPATVGGFFAFGIWRLVREICSLYYHG